VLSVPDETVHRTKVADWLELKAISAPDGRVGFGTLTSATALTENEQETDIGDENEEEEELIQNAQDEIYRRLENVGEDYPFRIDDNGRALRFITPITKVGSVYLFCLFLSHAYDRTIVSKELAPVITNKTRDWFQACATVAAGGYVTGPAISFGFPRPDGSGYLKSLRRVYKLFGDGKPCRRPRAAAAKKIKDNGIDVIAWRRSIDKLPCTLYLIAQVASGADWVDKSVKPDREHFHDYWFTEKPGSQASDAMFMPFGLEPDVPENGPAYEKVLTDYMQSVAYKYGTLFYRDRIARFVADGLKHAANGEKNIERIQDMTKVVRWVKSYMVRLQEAK
jgi:hypothetical protein